MSERIQYYNDIEIYKRQLIPVVTLTIESMCPLHALWQNWDNIKTYTIKFFMLKWIGVSVSEYLIKMKCTVIFFSKFY